MKNKNNLIRLLSIPKVYDDCELCYVQNPAHIPFSIKRVYYIFNAKLSLPRGAHAHYKTRQILFCIQGSIKMVLEDGKTREEVILNRPDQGIILNKMIWHEMHDFQKDTILLVLASRKYEEEDYIRNHEQFLSLTNGKNKKSDKI